MDSQLTNHSTSYAYTSNNYPHFYDTWVAHLFGTTSTDTPTYLSNLHPSTNPIIIDLCAGTGRVLKALLPHLPHSKLYGIDHSPSMLARGAETFPAGKKVEWKVASVTNFSNVLDEEDKGCVDMIVLSAGSIAHLTDQEEVRFFLKEAKNVLRPGTGVAVVSVLTECIPGKEAAGSVEPEYEAPLKLDCSEGVQKGWWIKSPTAVVWDAEKNVRTDTFSVEFYSADGGERVWREELKWSLRMFDEGAFKRDVDSEGLEIKEVVGEGEGHERFYILKVRA